MWPDEPSYAQEEYLRSLIGKREETIKDLIAAMENLINSIEVNDDRAVNMALAAIAKAEGR